MYKANKFQPQLRFGEYYISLIWRNPDIYSLYGRNMTFKKDFCWTQIDILVDACI